MVLAVFGILSYHGSEHLANAHYAVTKRKENKERQNQKSSCKALPRILQTEHL